MTASPGPPSRKRNLIFQFSLRDVLALILGVCIILASWHWFWKPAREAALYYERVNYLRQIGIAIGNHHDTYRGLPCSCSAYDGTRDPPHSWRICIYPFMESSPLFDLYDFGQPWDSPANLPLGNHGYFYRAPEHGGGPRASDAHFLAIVGPGTAFPQDSRVSLDDITDGPANTIIVAEVFNSGVHWLEPRDLHIEEMSFRINDRSRPSISGWRGEPPLVLFADGRVARLSPAIPAPTLRGLLTIAGGETIDIQDLEEAGWIMPR